MKRRGERDREREIEGEFERETHSKERSNFSLWIGANQKAFGFFFVHLQKKWKKTEIWAGAIGSKNKNHWKKVELRNSTFWNVGEKSGIPFSIWGTCGSWAISRLGWYIFFIFTAKKELFFSFQMAPTRGFYDHYFLSYDFMNLFLFYHIFTKIIFFIDPNFGSYVTMKEQSKYYAHWL